MSVLKEVIFNEGYGSPDELVRDWALIMALSKVEQYRAEDDFFKNKYGMDLQKFEAARHHVKGSEDFNKEEDLEDWEFSFNAFQWWGKKVMELQSAASGS